ncbi:MAG: Nif3-like dinuclear metal center hexameric protein [Ruminococcus sp.]|nr:Nif3-like dinuclear metal center hexameric protein [Ruminococcus sp.]
MQCKEIMEIIEAVYPKEAALSFDNVGLQAGRSNKEVKRIYLALDATKEVIQAAKDSQADMLITHHPLIFSPLKSVTDGDFISRRILELIQSDISYYAMHTNYDVLGMAGLAERILGLGDARVLDVTGEIDGREEGIGRIGMLEGSMTLKECCRYVKERLALDTVKVFGDLDREVQCLAVSPGSGKSAVAPAVKKGADVLVTGDIGHHDGLDAWEQGLAVIDAGHYGTEYIFIEDMKQFLETRLDGVEVRIALKAHPFSVQ